MGRRSHIKRAKILRNRCIDIDPWLNTGQGSSAFLWSYHGSRPSAMKWLRDAARLANAVRAARRG